MSAFSKKIMIGAREISDAAPVFVIAEAGVNHGGSLALAKQLVDIAVEAAADAVKFQAFRTEHLIVESVSKAPYQKRSTGAAESQTDMLKRLELSVASYRELKDYCHERGIIFLITPFDDFSVDELDEVGVEAYKVASTDTTNLPFLIRLAKRGKPIILSTGMCYLDEIEAALHEIGRYNPDVILMQCTADYPILDQEANLNVLNTFRETFDVLIGYSDHSTGLGAALYAIPMGAKVVEKHFTKDTSLEGPDHRASLDPGELKRFVAEVRRIETLMGSSVKTPTPAERLNRNALQKSLVARTPIRKGEPFNETNVVAKRTGGVGLSPIHFRKVFAMNAERDYAVNDIIEAPVCHVVRCRWGRKTGPKTSQKKPKTYRLSEKHVDVSGHRLSMRSSAVLDKDVWVHKRGMSLFPDGLTWEPITL